MYAPSAQYAWSAASGSPQREKLSATPSAPTGALIQLRLDVVALAPVATARSGPYTTVGGASPSASETNVTTAENGAARHVHLLDAVRGRRAGARPARGAEVVARRAERGLALIPRGHRRAAGASVSRTTRPTLIASDSRCGGLGRRSCHRRRRRLATWHHPSRRRQSEREEDALRRRPRDGSRHRTSTRLHPRDRRSRARPPAPRSRNNKDRGAASQAPPACPSRIIARMVGTPRQSRRTGASGTPALCTARPSPWARAEGCVLTRGIPTKCRRRSRRACGRKARPRPKNRPVVEKPKKSAAPAPTARAESLRAISAAAKPASAPGLDSRPPACTAAGAAAWTSASRAPSSRRARSPEVRAKLKLGGQTEAPAKTRPSSLGAFIKDASPAAEAPRAVASPRQPVLESDRGIASPAGGQSDGIRQRVFRRRPTFRVDDAPPSAAEPAVAPQQHEAAPAPATDGRDGADFERAALVKPGPRRRREVHRRRAPPAPTARRTPARFL